jgi:hypothetical protein
MANITMPGAEEKSEAHRGFVISWQEPPISSAEWASNVATDSRELFPLLGSGGAKVITGHTRDEMIVKAKRFVDDLLR